jgi:GTPase SAR1 family protein
MSQSRLRIAVSGPAGAGKTTLVNALASELSLPVIEEGLLPLYSAQVAYKQASQAPGALPDVKKRALSDWMRSFFDWCGARELTYAQLTDFVADRWELDIFGYWLHAFVQSETYEDTSRLHDIFLRRSQEFDLFVMLPAGNFQVDEHNEAGLRRQTSYNRSVLTQSSFTGLLCQVPGSIARYVPLAVEPIETRVADIVRIASRLRGG